MDVKEIKRKVMELLNKQYEENFIQGLGCDRLIQELDCSEEEFKDAVDLLRAKEWVERLNERVGGHYNLKLTVKGKRKFDEETCNRRNEQVRQHLLEKIYEMSQESRVITSDGLANELNEPSNVICYNLKDMEEEGLVELEEKVGAGHVAYDVVITPKGKEAYLNPPVDPNLCFVLMWFEVKLNAIYREVIKPAIEEIGMRCVRADERLDPKPIMDDILNQISKAGLIIADVTGAHCEQQGRSLTYTNPNVFFELGIAFAKRKDFIILTQSMDFVPFDLKHYRCIVYSDTADGHGKLREDLIGTIREIREAESF